MPLCVVKKFPFNGNVCERELKLVLHPAATPCQLRREGADGTEQKRGFHTKSRTQNNSGQKGNGKGMERRVEMEKFEVQCAHY